LSVTLDDAASFKLNVAVWYGYRHCSHFRWCRFFTI